MLSFYVGLLFFVGSVGEGVKLSIHLSATLAHAAKMHGAQYKHRGNFPYRSVRRGENHR